jgi:beta-1,2-mannobiose phosphorylase / 1,2-beta-oligomannan phosphorylase
LSTPAAAGPGAYDPGYRLERRGVLMHPVADDPIQHWGVLNPAAARDRQGDLWIFPRLVAEENHSRIGRARVRFDASGDPVGTDPPSIVLEPTELWEMNSRTAGVEDPRITWMPTLDRYVMTYTAYGPLGPRIGLALSTDLEDWERLGPLRFNYEPGLDTDIGLYPNKDALWFPEPVTAPDGSSAYAILHRPVWDLSEYSLLGYSAPPTGVADPRPGIWVSFADAGRVGDDIAGLASVGQHRQVATSEQPWELIKIGGGTPPIRTPGGWLMLYHGVAGIYEPGRDLQQRLHYAAGVMVHDSEDVTRLLYRSTEPLLEAETTEEQEGIVPNVVFPTGIDERGGGQADVFYGMADSRIGWARLTYPSA